MIFQEKLQKYAELAVRTGLNVQPGQEILVQCAVDNAEFGRMAVRACYEAGAKRVFVRWRDDPVSRLHYECQTEESLAAEPEWSAAAPNYIARQRGGILNILSSDPEAFRGIESAKLLASTKRAHELTKEFDEVRDKNELQWSIVAVPSEAWAKKMFPELPTGEAIERLWAAIFTACRMDEADPVAAWRKHGETLAAKGQWLNAQKFTKLRYQNSLGTDFTVGLPEGHIWMGGGDRTAQGVDYFPNMPTEEVFTMPHADRADGVVKSALPLSYQGSLISDFSLTFADGRVVDSTAKEGGEALARLLETDEGSRHLGEVALVPYHSPISNLGVLFYNTLFDENASCHLALGTCYPNTLEGGVELSKEELRQKGGNDSINHVDFMIGTKDLTVIGVKADGSEVPVFVNGDWA